MKKFLSTFILLFLLISNAQAQGEGVYLTFSESLGMNTFHYKMDNRVTSNSRPGYSNALGFQYFFSDHWGIGSGLGITYYSTIANYENSYLNDPTHYQFNDRIDDDWIPAPIKYDLQLRLSNWQEKQTAYFLEVPFMTCFQTKWGKKQRLGVYGGVGIKMQVPIFGNKFEVTNGSELLIQGYYHDGDGITIDGAPNGSPTHGFGKYNNTGFNSDLDIKMSFAGIFETGLLISLNRWIDLAVGGYFDFGLNNIKNGNKSDYDNAYLITPGNGNIHDESVIIKDRYIYNGIINSYVTEDVKLRGVGGKISLRMKVM